MTPFALTAIQAGLLVLLYLFVWRAVRTISLDLRGKRGSTPAPPPPRPKSTKNKNKNGPKVPTSVTIIDDRGKRVGTYRLAGAVDIGRAENATIRLDDTYASQRHARVVEREGGWVVEDLGSTNGTFLNDGRVETPTPLKAGDRIRIGTTTLELRA